MFFDSPPEPVQVTADPQAIPAISAAILLAQAEAQVDLGHAANARDAYARALGEYTKRDDRLGMADVAFGLGRLERSLGQGDRARANFRDAAKGYLDAGEPAEAARVLVALGDLERAAFQSLEASRRYAEARAAWAQVPEPKHGEHPILNLDAAPAMADGEAAARAALADADRIYAAIDDRGGHGDVLLRSAELERMRGDFDAAIARYRAAVDANRAGAALAEIGSIERFRHDPTAARAALEQALTLPAISRAAAQVELGTVTLATGAAAKAAALFNEAHATFVASADPVGEAKALLGIGDAAMVLREWGTAVVSYETAAVRFGAAGIPFGQIVALLGQGDALRATGVVANGASIYAMAAGVRGRLDGMVAEANRLLGLPAVELTQTDVPNPNAEGKVLAAATDRRLTAALAY